MIVMLRDVRVMFLYSKGPRHIFIPKITAQRSLSYYINSIDHRSHCLQSFSTNGTTPNLPGLQNLMTKIRGIPDPLTRHGDAKKHRQDSVSYIRTYFHRFAIGKSDFSFLANQGSNYLYNCRNLYTRLYPIKGSNSNTSGQNKVLHRLIYELFRGCSLGKFADQPNEIPHQPGVMTRDICFNQSHSHVYSLDGTWERAPIVIVR